jgi:hypothetical protein
VLVVYLASGARCRYRGCAEHPAGRQTGYVQLSEARTVWARSGVSIGGIGDAG